MHSDTDPLTALGKAVIACMRCPRLRIHRERVAREKVPRFAGSDYWGKPVPGFGDPRARLLVLGLAPAAHGGNRTGRVFTGDRSGEWLFRSLFAAGFADRPLSEHRRDGLRLYDCYVTAAVRCARPRQQTPARRVRYLPGVPCSGANLAGTSTGGRGARTSTRAAPWRARSHHPCPGSDTGRTETSGT